MLILNLGGYKMDDKILTQLLDCFKTVYGIKLDSPEAVFKIQQNLMEFVMGLGRGLENKVFAQAGTGYRGAIVEKNGNRYRFIGNRPTSIHGLFGMIRYRRAYYVSEEKEALPGIVWMKNRVLLCGYWLKRLFFEGIPRKNVISRAF
jgi:hypothetical protein